MVLGPRGAHARLGKNQEKPMRKQLLSSAAIIVASVTWASAQSAPDAKKQQPAQAQSQQQPRQDNTAQDRTKASNPAASQNSGSSNQASQPANSENKSASQPSSSGAASNTDQSKNSADKADNKADSNKAASESNKADSNKAASDNKPDANKAASDNNKPDANKAASDTNKADTNKAASDTNKSDSNKAASDTKNQPANAQNNRQQDNAQRNDAKRNDAKQDSARKDNAQQNNRAASNTKVTREQETKITTAIRTTNVKPVTNINFSIGVGVVIPGSVSLHPLPANVIAIVPEYRGYDFFLARDEIVIVEPRTKKIVTVISQSSQAAVAPSRERVSFSNEQREAIRKHTRSRNTTGAGTRTTVTVGQRVPDSVELRSFDEDVYTVVPTVRTYRYIESPRGIYLIDPQQRTVIEEID
jgi:hypothetical protein